MMMLLWRFIASTSFVVIVCGWRAQSCNFIYMCVCVWFLPIHSGHQVRWTYQPGSHRRKVTQEEGHTGFLIRLFSAVRALIFLARRIQPFLSLVDREVEFCV